LLLLSTSAGPSDDAHPLSGSGPANVSDDYAVSYLFIAIVWTNHHYLMRYATEATHRLLWFNFAHLFSMSLLPLSTAWMAVSELAPEPVAFYAMVFFLVNATYIGLIWELIDRAPVDEVSPTVRRIMRVRSIATLCLFGVAAAVLYRGHFIGRHVPGRHKGANRELHHLDERGRHAARRASAQKIRSAIRRRAMTTWPLRRRA
jgi:transmembrane protein TMEM174 (potassium channel)